MTTSAALDLSVTVASRNRPDELSRCINSLAALAPLRFEVIVLDDGSDVDPRSSLSARLPPGYPVSPHIIRWPASKGTIAARNHLLSVATAPFVLSLDDDAFLLPDHGIAAALSALKGDDRVGAMGFPQRDAEGALWGAQPAHAGHACYAVTFYGYASLLRRQAVLDAGGYRELWYQEEAECAKRLAAMGYTCVLWPDVKVAHVPSRLNRAPDAAEFFVRTHLSHRCKDAILNEPLPLLLVTLLGTTVRSAVTRMSGEAGRPDLKRTRWLLGEIVREFRRTWKDRQPLPYRVYVERQWTRWMRPRYRRPPD